MVLTGVLLYGCGLAYLFQTVGVKTKILLGTLFGKVLEFLPLAAGRWITARQPFTSGQVLIVAFTLQILLLYRFERVRFSAIMGRLTPSCL